MRGLIGTLISLIEKNSVCGGQVQMSLSHFEFDFLPALIFLWLEREKTKDEQDALAQIKIRFIILLR